MDTPASVDRNAPVLAHHEIDISAPVSRVWPLHQDVNAWPTWQSDITAARMNGAFAPGESFTWTSFGFTVTSTVYAVQDQSRVLWGGTGDGITGVHEWVFTATPGGTHVETTESFAGAPVEADVAGMRLLHFGAARVDLVVVVISAVPPSAGGGVVWLPCEAGLITPARSSGTPPRR